MTEIRARPKNEGVKERLDPEVDRVVALPNIARKRRRRYGGALLGGSALLLLLGGLGTGAWRHYQAELEVAATAQQSRTFVPDVRVAAVRASDSKITVTLPATTTAFEAANIFARTSGYIEKRYVDIGDRVKAGALLADITAPELDHQITQAKATLAQNQATLQQTQASRELAQVTNARDSKLVKQGWLTLQQGDNDRLTLQAQQAAVGVAQSNIAAQEAQIRILEQEKAYQRVVAPFDGVITQRNIDNGSLVTSGSTFMFTLMHPDVIRTQVFVPQDEAFGLGPGVDAVVRVPEIPDRTFPGKVTRIATALQPGSRTLLTEIDVPNPDGALSPGIYCTVELFIPRKTPSMIIPADAVVFDQNGLHVAVVENGTAHLQKITIARDFGTEVEVHDGVKPGDQVILNPMVNLAEGSKVAVRKSRRQARSARRKNRDATLAVHGSHPAVRLQRQPGAGLHHGHHSHGPFIDARDDRDFPAQWPEPVLGDDPAGRSRHDAGAGAAGFRPYDAGNGRDLFHTNRANRAWNSGSASYFHVGNGRHNRNDAIGFRGTDDISSTSGLFHVHNG